MSHPPQWAQTSPCHLLPKGADFSLSSSDRICILPWNEWWLSMALSVLKGEGSATPENISICCAVWSLEQGSLLLFVNHQPTISPEGNRVVRANAARSSLKSSHPPPLFPVALSWTGAELSSRSKFSDRHPSASRSVVLRGSFKPQIQSEIWEVGKNGKKKTAINPNSCTSVKRVRRSLLAFSFDMIMRANANLGKETALPTAVWGSCRTWSTPDNTHLMSFNFWITRKCISPVPLQLTVIKPLLCRCSRT